MVDKAKLKEIACKAVHDAIEELNDLSLDIWNNPELKFEEKHAHKVLTEFLDKHGFKVEKNYILETGFKGQHGSEGKGPHVSLICEYDALPDIGHACGHNLIAEIGVGAGLAIKAALEAAMKEGQELGQVTVFGTPAEEGGGGKIDFINGDAFKDVDIAMMSHPCNETAVYCDAASLACTSVKVKYSGKASHAAMCPWEGINALNAAVSAYISISAMRQQIKPTWKIHGVITKGGYKPNIIPEEAELDYHLRAPTIKEIDILKEKAVKCFESAAVSTGCEVQFEWRKKSYSNVITNKHLANLYKENATKVEVKFSEKKEILGGGSTDMGNVSHIVPSIHPLFYIGTDAALHTREFAKMAGDVRNKYYTVKQSKALAMTAIDVMCDPENLKKIKENFKADIEKGL